MNPSIKIERLNKIIISPDLPISEAIGILDRAGIGVLLLCKENNLLVGILTDGDIRRAILKNISFDNSCITIAGKRPLTAPSNISAINALNLMDTGRDFIVNQLPLVDSEGRVVGILLRRDLISEESIPISAVIMAGGFGKRMRPFTEDLPKPMLEVGGRPLLEHTIDQLCQSGINNVNITTHYRAEAIQKHFGDGADFGIRINYVPEDQPLGTAGALSLLEPHDEPILVINGDILTKVDFRSMLKFHQENNSDLTVGVSRYDIQIPFGVVDTNGIVVQGITEKPQMNFLVNAGIYLIEPSVLDDVPEGEPFDMTDLIQILSEKGGRIINFPIVEYWLDIGELSDYERAQNDIKGFGE